MATSDPFRPEIKVKGILMTRLQIIWILLPLALLFINEPAQAQECTAYCICNGVSAPSCTRDFADCPSPKTAFCANASCGMKALCCCSERVFQPSGDGGGTMVLKLTNCKDPTTCQEMCGGGGFLVYGDEGATAEKLLAEINDPQKRAYRARLKDWALVDIEMVEGRELNYRPLYASSTRFAVDQAMASGLENYMMPGHTIDYFTSERPPGGILKEITVDQKGLRAHLLEVLGEKLLELDGSRMGITIVLDADGVLDSIQLLYSEPQEFAEILLPVLEQVYPLYAGHTGKGRTMDVFTPNVHSGGTMLGLHHAGSYLLDVHPFRE